MSRITYRGRNHWSSNGRPAGHGLPLERETRLVRLLRPCGGFTTHAAKSVALATVLYFAAQLVRAWL